MPAPRSRALREHFALGPVLAARVEEVGAKSSLDQTAWEYGVASATAWLDRPRTAYGLWQAVIAAIVGVVVGLVAADSLLLGIATAVPTTVVSYWAVPTLWACGAALLAPVKQRDKALTLLGSARDLKRLVLLERHLQAISESNMRTINAVRNEGRSGPLGQDQFGNQDEPWIKGQNDQMRLWLEAHGFSELVPDLILIDPPLNTWEEVDQAAWEIARRLGRVLEGPLFKEVRSLDQL